MVLDRTIWKKIMLEFTLGLVHTFMDIDDDDDDDYDDEGRI